MTQRRVVMARFMGWGQTPRVAGGGMSGRNQNRAASRCRFRWQPVGLASTRLRFRRAFFSADHLPSRRAARRVAPPGAGLASGQSESGHMKTARVTQSKNGLSGLLRTVREGRSVLILDRGVPVARLEPVTAGSLPDDARLLGLERQGLVRRNPGAGRLLRLHALRAADALQLAAAVIRGIRAIRGGSRTVGERRLKRGGRGAARRTGLGAVGNNKAEGRRDGEGERERERTPGGGGDGLESFSYSFSQSFSRVWTGRGGSRDDEGRGEGERERSRERGAPSCDTGSHPAEGGALD